MISSFSNIIKGFSDAKILVIGDIALDEYIKGTVERISPEAPIPIVHVKEVLGVPGCAANTASNILSLGGKAYLIGVVGNDIAAKTLMKIIESKGIDPAGIVFMDNFSTIKKTRIIGLSSGNSQQLARVDNEEQIFGHEDSIIEKIDLIVPKVDIIIVSDYAKGLMNEKVSGHLKIVAERCSKRILVDTKPKNVHLYENVYMLKPNLKEAEEIIGKKILDNDDAIKAGKIIQKRYHANVLMTRSAKGMDVFEDDKHAFIPSIALQLSDVSGAGDTVIAATALSLAYGQNLIDSAFIANYAACIVVGKSGTATTTQEELIGYIDKTAKHPIR